MPDTTVDKSGRMDPSTPLTAREAAALDEVDEQRARAEAAEQQLAKARLAIRLSDWDALWHALGVEDVSLPQMRTALDTAADLDELTAEPAGLTGEQEIRAEAMADATRCLQGALTRYGDLRCVDIAGDAALALAARFETYIRDGDA